MAKYRIDEDGDLRIDFGECCGYIAPEDFPKILALIAPPATAKPEAKPGPWYMDGDKLRYHGRRWHVCYNDTGADDAEICAWVVANQPEVSAEDLAFLTDGENSPGACAERLHEIRARMEAPADKPAPKLCIDEDGDLMTADDRCVALRHANRDNIFARSLALDLTGDELDSLADMPSRVAVNWLDRRLDEVASAETSASLWTVDGDGDLRYKGRYVAGAGYDHDGLIPRIIAAQPVIDAETERIMYEEWSEPCLEALRPFVADSAPPAEATKDCDRASVAPDDSVPAPEFPCQRNVIITITFDPADTEQAAIIYNAINEMGYVTRRDCVRIRVE